MGPVVARAPGGPEVVRASPDTWKVRGALLSIVEQSAAVHIEEMTPREETALWQLAAWREGRAQVVRDRIAGVPLLLGTPRSGREAARTSGSPDGGTFRSAARLGRVVVVLLTWGALVSLALLVSNVRVLGLVSRAESGTVRRDELDTTSAWQHGLTLLQLGVFVATGVAFLVWLHRAYANLRPIGAPHVRHAPGFAVSCWFLPVANLVLPMRVVQELADKSGGRSDHQPRHERGLAGRQSH